MQDVIEDTFLSPQQSQASIILSDLEPVYKVRGCQPWFITDLEASHVRQTENN